jgi:hypothetical protein
MFPLKGGLLKKTEMSEVLTEITKMDPNLDTNEFLKFVQTDIIPNVLESFSRRELEILKDWFTETVWDFFKNFFEKLILLMFLLKRLLMFYHYQKRLANNYT